MNQHEIPLKKIIKEKFQRGRFEVSILIQNDKTERLVLNRTLAKNIYESLLELQKELSLPGEIRLETLAGYREIFTEEECQYTAESLLNVVHEAVKHLESMRVREGEILVRDIRERMKTLGETNKNIQMLAPDATERWRMKLEGRIRSLIDDTAIDENRIIQEVTVMSEKMDISEELSRIDSHLQQGLEILDNETIIGKKLDFLLQEIMREINTLSYKANDHRISHLAVEMKTEIEKVREQVQNIQ
jgi:uncharacterized protein (TIGR00255 family)